MKKLLLAFLSAMLILSAAGCGSGTQTGEDNSIPILDRIYLNNSPLSEKSMDFDFLKFYNDGTFQEFCFLCVIFVLGYGSGIGYLNFSRIGSVSFICSVQSVNSSLPKVTPAPSSRTTPA